MYISLVEVLIILRDNKSPTEAIPPLESDNREKDIEPTKMG
jgi:hypothetical protein